MTFSGLNFPQMPGTHAGARQPGRRAAFTLLVAVLALAAGRAAPHSARDGRQTKPAHAPAAGTVLTEDNALGAYGALPLAFVPNVGQADPRVRLSAQAAGASFYFTPAEAVFTFRKGRKGLALRLAFLAANPAPHVAGVRPGAGRVNYLNGSDPARWRTGLPTYGEIVYRDLWPGIDLAFRGEGGALKYEFRVAAGADPRDIRLAYRGAERLSLDATGDLLVHTARGVLRDSRPVSYQEAAGARVPVASEYLLAGSSYGIALGSYDPQRPLVIDPGLAYSTYLGGSQSDVGFDVAVDTSGSAYVTGETGASNFPTTAGAFDTTFNGGANLGQGDVFVTKLNPQGSALEYSTYLGGSANERGHGIAVDAGGSAYVTGWTASANFPTTSSAFDTSHNGGLDAFVAKLDATGSSLLYATYLGGSLVGILGGGPDDEGAGIAVDAEGHAYVTGGTRSRDFPTTPGAFDTTYTNGSGSHVFVTKLSVDGAGLLYSTYLGGLTFDEGNAIAVDAAGAAYVTGTTSSRDFPTTPGAFDTTPSFTQDTFVTKLSAGGAGLLYSTYLGGSAADQSTGIAVDTAGKAYVTGWGNSPDFPTSPGAFDTSYNGGSEAFVAAFNPDGSALLYSTYLGGSGSENCFALAVDAAGNAHVTGSTTSADFPTTADAFDTTNDNADAFFTKLNVTGSALLYSTYLGGGANDVGRGIALDTSGGVYVTGNTGSNNFPTTPGAFGTTGGLGDAFVTKLSNRPPGAADDAAATDEDSPVTISPLANDADPDGDALTLRSFTQGAHGSVVISPGNTVTYSPAPDFNGADSFTYTVADTWGDTDTATVTVTVAGVQDAPAAGDDAAAVSEDGGASRIDVLVNDFDLDGDPLVVASVTQGAHGAVVNQGTAVSYTPAPNYAGPDSFTYTVADGQGGLDAATVTVTVVNVNDAPAAGDDAYSLGANTALVVPAPGVLANDADADGGALSAVLVTGVSNGTLALAPDGSFTYTPGLNFSGADAFTYRAFDGASPSDVVTARIAVTFNLFVFSSTRDGNAEIYSLSADGAVQTRLTDHPATDVFPAWSPDRARVAFSSNRGGSFEVYVMNADGGSPTRLTSGALVDGGASWSPDGTRLAFSSYRDGNPEIYVMNADGTGLTRLTKHPGADVMPSWSPDGTKLAFSSDRKRSFEIYVINADGTRLTQLTKNSFAEADPAWSPDGTTIAFTSDRDGNLEIYSMDAGGGGQTRLTNNPAADSEPAWSSDGGRIAFASDRDGSLEIYLMNADGGGLIRLTTNTAADTSPDW